MIKLYYASGACSFVPHVALEAARANGGGDFEPAPIRLHRGEHQTPDYLAMNPDGQVPVLEVDGERLTQIVAICDYLDRRFPDAGLLPTEPWARAKAMQTLAWLNNTVHPTFTHVFLPNKFAADAATQATIKAHAVEQYRGLMLRLQDKVAGASPFLCGERLTLLDPYVLTVFRWGGIAGIDPATLPGLKAYVDRVAAHPAVAAAMAREKLSLDTYKG